MSLLMTVHSHKLPNINCKVTNLEMSNAGTTATRRFRGSEMEKELEALHKNGLIDQTTTAKEAYEMSLVFKRDITFDKFQPKYYNWRRKKSFSEEAGRNGGYGPPEGTLIIILVNFLLSWTNHYCRCSCR